jgi:RNA polymerase sigma factor (sigma-70 family)
MESSAGRSLDRLVTQARRGSRSALEHLMMSCRPWLRHEAGARLPRGLARKHDASDLVQEVQYRGVARFDTFRGQSGGEFRAWLAGILKRLVFQELRFWAEQRRDRRREEPLSPAWGADADLAATGTGTSALTQLSRDEEHERLEQAKSWCRADDLAIIARHLDEGRSHEDVAAELEIAVATARQRYSRAVRRVGEALHLLELMTRRGWNVPRQDAVGLHRFQGAGARQIAGRLLLPEELVTRWIDEAGPLLRAIARDAP